MFVVAVVGGGVLLCLFVCLSVRLNLSVCSPQFSLRLYSCFSSQKDQTLKHAYMRNNVLRCYVTPPIIVLDCILLSPRVTKSSNKETSERIFSIVYIDLDVQSADNGISHITELYQETVDMSPCSSIFLMSVCQMHAQKKPLSDFRTASNQCSLQSLTIDASVDAFH